MWAVTFPSVYKVSNFLLEFSLWMKILIYLVSLILFLSSSSFVSSHPLYANSASFFLSCFFFSSSFSSSFIFLEISRMLVNHSLSAFFFHSWYAYEKIITFFNTLTVIPVSSPPQGNLGFSWKFERDIMSFKNSSSLTYRVLWCMWLLCYLYMYVDIILCTKLISMCQWLFTCSWWYSILIYR